MYKYGQYCPIAKAVEILGDRWTLLIVRDLLTGTSHFNDLERGLPGISRGLLADRLRRLQKTGLVEKVTQQNGRQRTAYHLTESGRDLQEIVNSLLVWGTRWAFGAPEEEDLDPALLMWWIRDRTCVDKLPEPPLVIQFDFTGASEETYWLLIQNEDVSICMTDPGFGLDVLVTADLATFFQVWLGRTSFEQAQREGLILLEGASALTKALPDWLGYSLAAPAVRAAVAS